MSTWILVIMLGGLVGLDATSFPQVMISRPIVACTLTGALFGRPVDGIIIGFILEAFSLINLPIGAARYPEAGTAAVAGTSAALAAAPAGLEPGHMVLAVAIALGWERVAAATVVANRKYNGRLLTAGVGVAASKLEKRHLTAMSVDFARGALVSGSGGLLGYAAVSLVWPFWGLSGPLTGAALGVIAAGVIGTAIPLFGGVRAHPAALAGGAGLALLVALVLA